MRLHYIFYGQDKEPHSFQVKSNWQPEEVKTELAEVKISKAKNNLPISERQALKELKQNNNIIVKMEDKGTTTVIISSIAIFL